MDAVTGEILHDAYQSTASYLAAVAGTLANRSVRQTCNVDGNGVMDRRDVAAIMAARNTAASGLTDPRDADGNGLIDVLDARRCTLVCGFANCASTH